MFAGQCVNKPGLGVADSEPMDAFAQADEEAREARGVQYRIVPNRCSHVHARTATDSEFIRK